MRIDEVLKYENRGKLYYIEDSMKDDIDEVYEVVFDEEIMEGALVNCDTKKNISFTETLFDIINFSFVEFEE